MLFDWNILLTSMAPFLPRFGDRISNNLPQLGDTTDTDNNLKVYVREKHVES